MLVMVGLKEVICKLTSTKTWFWPDASAICVLQLSYQEEANTGKVVMIGNSHCVKSVRIRSIVVHIYPHSD